MIKSCRTKIRQIVGGSIPMIADIVKKKCWDFYNKGANLRQGTVSLEIGHIIAHHDWFYNTKTGVNLVH